MGEDAEAVGCCALGMSVWAEKGKESRKSKKWERGSGPSEVLVMGENQTVGGGDD